MSDGLAWNDCNLNAFAEEADGTIWIGTSGGLSRFRPRPHTASQGPLEVVFTSLVMGKTDLTGQSQASPLVRANSLIARFSALNATRANGAIFRYRLIGANSIWNETAQRELQFAQLAPGTYRLEVEARCRWRLEWPRSRVLVQGPHPMVCVVVVYRPVRDLACIGGWRRG